MIEPWSEHDLWPGGTNELLLVGPPGTGKTRNVLRSYVWPALQRQDVIIATSYTRAAAEELRDRTANELGGTPSSYSADLTTIHSEAYRRCRGLGLALHTKGDKVTESEEEVMVDDMAARMREDSMRDAMTAWDRTRSLFPGDIGKPIEERLKRVGLYGAELYAGVGAVMRDLEGRMRDGVLVTPDFTGLLELALTHGADREIDLLAVDEAQDLSTLQWALVDRWARSAKRVLIVGDPDQSIYGYAGADGRRLIRWLRDGRMARRLHVSHRVPKKPHAESRKVILQVTDRVDAPYAPASHDGSVTHAYADTAWRRIIAAQDDGTKVFVLSRTRKGVSKAAADLEARDIPHFAERGRSLLGTASAPSFTLDVVYALRDIATSRTVDAASLRRFAKALDSSRLPRGAKARLVAMADGRRSAVQVDDLEDVGLSVAELRAAWAGGMPEQKTMGALFLLSCVSPVDIVRIAGWLRRWRSDLVDVASLVTVTTCHASKGREAPLVVIDARTKARGQPTPEEQDEDRRVLYVAITRTQDHLVYLRGQAGADWLTDHGL